MLTNQREESKLNIRFLLQDRFSKVCVLKTRLFELRRRALKKNPWLLFMWDYESRFDSFTRGTCKLADT